MKLVTLKLPKLARGRSKRSNFVHTVRIDNYSPLMATWLGRDPHAGHSSRTQSFKRYERATWHGAIFSQFSPVRRKELLLLSALVTLAALAGIKHPFVIIQLHLIWR